MKTVSWREHLSTFSFRTEMSLMVLQGKAKGKGKLRHRREEARFPHACRAAGQERAVWEEPRGEAKGGF